jgi:hypothetical protein
LHCTHKKIRKHPINKKKGAKAPILSPSQATKKTKPSKKKQQSCSNYAQKKSRAFHPLQNFQSFRNFRFGPVCHCLFTLTLHKTIARLCRNLAQGLFGNSVSAYNFYYLSLLTAAINNRSLTYGIGPLVLLRYSSLKFADSGFAGVAFTGAASVTVCAAAGRFFTPLFGAGGVFSSKMRLGNSVSLCSPSAKVANVAKTKPEDPLLKL